MGLGDIQVGYVTVNAYHHAASVVTDCGVWMRGGIIQELGDGIKCFLGYPGMLQGQVSKGKEHCIVYGQSVV